MVRTHVAEVARGLYLLRVDDDKTKYFEALWEIPEGITYNAYLLKTSEGSVLFDGWKSVFSDLLVEELKKLTDLDDIKWIVVHHMEPDHSGSLKRVLEETNFRPEILGRPIVKDMIRSFYNIEVKFRPVKDLEVMRVGGYTLKFISTPWLHWPETMVTYVEELKTLITCDVFGGFGLPHGIFDDEVDVDNYLDEVKKYVVTVIGSYRPHIVRNIEKLRKLGLDVKLIAPGHGLLWRRDPKRVVDLYYNLAKGDVKENKVTVIYDSMYGFVKRAISELIRELESKGIAVRTFAFNDRERPQISDLLLEVIDSRLIVLGISTYENDVFPIMKYVLDTIIRKADRDVPVLIVSSYGWGPVVATKVLEILKSSKFKLVDVLQFRGAPDEEYKSKVRRILSEILS